MAKVKGLHQSPRAPSMRRAVTFRPHADGHVAQAWPISRRRSLSPKQKEAIATFKEAAIVAKYAPAADQMRSRQLAHGSQFLPRDLQYMAIFGRLCTLFFTNGERRYQLASRYDLTELLDILGFAPGSILFRGPEFWEALLPGTPGQVLTTQGENEPLTWEQAGGGGAAGGWGSATIEGSSTAHGGSFASKGCAFTPLKNLTISAIHAALGGTGGTGTNMAQLVEFDNSLPGRPVKEVLAVSAVSPILPNTNTPYRFELGSQVELKAGNFYGLFITRENLSDTGECRIRGIASSSGWLSMNGPVNVEYPAIQLARKVPQPGDLVTVVNSRYFLIWAEGGVLPEA